MAAIEVEKSRAMTGKAGRYMSMANGLTTLNAPSSEMTNKSDRLAGKIGTFR